MGGNGAICKRHGLGAKLDGLGGTGEGREYVMHGKGAKTALDGKGTAARDNGNGGKGGKGYNVRE